MVLLIHHPVSPHSRKIRLEMSEKKMLFVLKEEEPWALSADVYKLNPAGELPIFVSDGNVISGDYAISEYLEEISAEIRLMPESPRERAEIRRLMSWFDDIAKFIAILSRKKFLSVSARGWLRTRAS